MNPGSGKSRLTPFESIMKYFGVAMALIYVGVGFLLLKANDSFNIPNQYAIPLGIVLIGYGVFRGYRLYQKYFQKS